MVIYWNLTMLMVIFHGKYLLNYSTMVIFHGIYGDWTDFHGDLMAPPVVSL